MWFVQTVITPEQRKALTDAFDSYLNLMAKSKHVKIQAVSQQLGLEPGTVKVRRKLVNLTNI